MSSLYNLEPQPTAKVLLQTTAGDVLLELFAKQTPLTSRNFLQHCLDGYYDDTIFHRLVPGFIIQGGDPTGTGNGGESIYSGEEEGAFEGGFFKDEFHSRLKFNRRGLLGMANESRKDSNGSQFFLTLGQTPELGGQNTMFGRVVGDTIYNLMKMGETELMEGEGSERPLYPTKITGTEILVNPFEDMVQREVKRRAAAVEEKPKKKPSKRKAGKALLSFGADEEGAEDAAPTIKKPKKFNSKLVSAGPEDPAAMNNTPLPKAPAKKDAKPIIERRVTLSPSPSPPAQPISKLAKRTVPISEPIKPSRPAARRSSRSPSTSPSLSPEPELHTRKPKSAALLKDTNAEIANIKASMRRTGPSAPVQEKPKSAIEQMMPSTSTRGRKRRPGALSSAEEARTLSMLTAFKNKLDAAPPSEALGQEIELPDNPSSKQGINGSAIATTHSKENKSPDSAVVTAEDEAHLCDLHFIANCQSCSKWDERDGAAGPGEEEEDDAGWMSHALSFAKDRLGKNLEWKRKNEEELVVIDPREKERKLMEERKEKRKGENRLKDRGRDWDREREKGGGRTERARR